jgi:hypothetical protein
MKYNFNTPISKPNKKDHTLDMYISKSIYNSPEPVKARYLTKHVKNQFSSNECVPCAISSIISDFIIAEQDRDVEMSAANIYINRFPKHYSGEGMYLKEALQIAQKSGTNEARYFEMFGTYEEVKKEFERLENKLISLAYPNKIKAYARLNNINEASFWIKETGFSILLAVPVYTSFLESKGDFLGNHAMKGTEIFYRDGIPRINCLNSYGKEWGRDGYNDISDSLPREMWGIIDENPKDWTNEIIEMMFVIGSENVLLSNGKESWTEKMGAGEYPILHAARTKVPMRFPFEKLGMFVDWYPSNKEDGSGSTIHVHKYPDSKTLLKEMQKGR